MRTDPRARRPSHKWLVVAVVASVLAPAVAGIAVIDLFRSPRSGSRGDLSIASTEPGPLTVAVARTAGGPAEWSSYGAVFKAISDETGREVRIRYVSEEEKSAEVLLKDRPDIAFICVHTYLDVRDRGTVRAIATPILNGRKDCSSILVVQKESPYRTLSDLRGARVAASDKTSLGGYAFLRWLLAENGETNRSFFGSLKVGDTMENNLRDLENGELDAVAANTAQVVDRDMTGLRVIEASPAFALPPVVVDSRMDAATVAQVSRALLRFDAAAVLGGKSHLDGFAPIDEKLFAFGEVLRNSCDDQEHMDAHRKALGSGADD